MVRSNSRLRRVYTVRLSEWQTFFPRGFAIGGFVWSTPRSWRRRRGNPTRGRCHPGDARCITTQKEQSTAIGFVWSTTPKANQQEATKGRFLLVGNRTKGVKTERSERVGAGFKPAELGWEARDLEFGPLVNAGLKSALTSAKPRSNSCAEQAKEVPVYSGIYRRSFRAIVAIVGAVIALLATDRPNKRWGQVLTRSIHRTQELVTGFHRPKC